MTFNKDQAQKEWDESADNIVLDIGYRIKDRARNGGRKLVYACSKVEPEIIDEVMRILRARAFNVKKRFDWVEMKKVLEVRW